MADLADLRDTHWSGSAELWLDPLGDEAQRSECTIAVDAGVVRYTWQHGGNAHTGSIELREPGAEFTDTWHQPERMKCRLVPGAVGLFQVQGAYGPGADWGWRIALVLRPHSDELVLQMTNVAPWGEEVRAVRFICKRMQ